jgi:hypothetical protein
MARDKITISGANSRINIGSVDRSTNVSSGRGRTPRLNINSVDRSVNREPGPGEAETMLRRMLRAWRAR